MAPPAPTRDLCATGPRSTPSATPPRSVSPRAKWGYTHLGGDPKMNRRFQGSEANRLHCLRVLGEAGVAPTPPFTLHGSLHCVGGRGGGGGEPCILRILPSLRQDKDEEINIKMKQQVITGHFPRNRVRSCQPPNRLRGSRPPGETRTAGSGGRGACWLA